MQQLDQYDEGFVERGFDAVAARYGEVPFLRRAAEVLVDVIAERAAARALDVATGPGTTALGLAQRCPGCSIVGIDVAPTMVEAATNRARQLSLSGAHFQVASALALPFERASFDTVLCSNAIYYMPDFDLALEEWRRVLRPSGVLAFSTFGRGVLEPMTTLFDARVRENGIVVPQPTPLYRLTSSEACRELLARAGLRDISTRQSQVGYWVSDEEAWWQTLMSTGFRALVEALEPAAREHFERAHKAEVRSLLTPRGLWIDVPVIVAWGRKR